MATQQHTTSSNLDYLLQILVDLGGGEYKGVQEGFRDKDGGVFEALCLFNSPATRTTLAIKVSEVTANAVRERIRESDEVFEQYKKFALGGLDLSPWHV